ncbi:MAG: hypothetical protein IPJ88_00840 [Myxococcales bacterium]|nr:MAG: hypothetical protein IPJ88_00840 [Myxococcales bacterium]
MVPPPGYPLPETQYDYEERSSAGSAADEGMAQPSAPSMSQSYRGGASSKSSSAAPARKRSSRNERPGLGTKFAETHYSSVEHVTFSRASWSHPAYILGARYNNRTGLVALGIDVDRFNRQAHDLRLRQSASPFSNGYATPPPNWEYR